MKKEYSNPNFRLLHVGEDVITTSSNIPSGGKTSENDIHSGDAPIHWFWEE